MNAQAPPLDTAQTSTSAGWARPYPSSAATSTRSIDCWPSPPSDSAIASAGQPSSAPESALDAIQAYGVTHGQFVPTMFVRMLKLPESERAQYDVSSLQRVVHAAAPCPPDIKRQMLDWWGPIVDEFYGSSEGVGVSYIRAEEWLAHPGSVGRPLAGVPHIVGEDGAELPPGEPGDVYFEGGRPFSYLNDEAKTAAARNEHGWLSVGDIGYLDHDGYLYLTDRRHHMIISGGVNIYPQEAEDALISHPRVLDAAVFGHPRPGDGQSAKAVVQPVD